MAGVVSAAEYYRGGFRRGIEVGHALAEGLVQDSHSLLHEETDRFAFQCDDQSECREALHFVRNEIRRFLDGSIVAAHADRFRPDVNNDECVGAREDILEEAMRLGCGESRMPESEWGTFRK